MAGRAEGEHVANLDEMGWWEELIGVWLATLTRPMEV